MHPSAMSIGKAFFDTYAEGILSGRVIDLGSQDVYRSLKSVCPAHLAYTGVDFVAGEGVDIVLDDPYVLPFENSSVDVIVSSSVFQAGLHERDQRQRPRRTECVHQRKGAARGSGKT